MSKYNAFNRLSIDTTDFEDHPYGWDFISAGIIVLNESTTPGDIIEYSFDGINVHGDLDPSLPSVGLAFNNRHESKIYFRLQSAGSAVSVRIEVWA